MKEYLTVNEKSSGEYTEKRSKFISSLYPCKSEEEAFKILQTVKSDNFGANHNVYAFVLSDNTARFSDDGEPHQTAGKPVLDVLKGSGICDAVLIVTRYFGGVLLGTGGLVRAYKTAAQSAISNAKPVKMCESAYLSVTCEYSMHKKLLTLIEKAGGEIQNTDFADKVNTNFVLPLQSEEAFLDDIKETFSSKITAKREIIDVFPFKTIKK